MKRWKKSTVSEILCKSNLKSRRYANLKITYTKKFTLPESQTNTFHLATCPPFDLKRRDINDIGN